MRSFFPISVPDDPAKLTAAVHENTWGTAAFSAGRAVMPRFLARSPRGLTSLPGTSTLGPNGPLTGVGTPAPDYRLP